MKEEKKKEVDEEEEEEEEEESAPGSTLFIKNLNFSTTEEKLQEVGQFINTTLSGTEVVNEGSILASYRHV